MIVILGNEFLFGFNRLCNILRGLYFDILVRLILLRRIIGRILLVVLCFLYFFVFLNIFKILLDVDDLDFW